MKLWRAANWTLMLLFILAVMVQYNDPDPIQWMAIYGAAAVACGLALRERLPRLFAAAVALVALVWAATLAVGVVGKQNLWYAEEGREMMGLVIVGVWMAILALRRPRPVAAA
jgi:hypothetical protein